MIRASIFWTFSRGLACFLVLSSLLTALDCWAQAQPQFITEIDAQEAEELMKKRPELYRHVLNEFERFRQCNDIFVWDDKGHYTWAKYLGIAAYPTIFYTAPVLLHWVAMRAWQNKANFGRMAGFNGGRGKIKWDVGPKPLKSVGIVGGFLTLGILLAVITNTIADGDKYVCANTSLQEHFDSLRVATPMKLREAIRTDVMTKGSLEEVSFELSRLTCGENDEAGPWPRKSTHGDFVVAPTTTPAAPSKDSKKDEKEITATENYLLSAGQANEIIDTNRQLFIRISTMMSILSECPEVWVKDPESGKMQKAMYYVGGYLLAAGADGVFNYMILTALSARALQMQNPEVRIRRRGLRIYANGERLVPKRKLFALKFSVSAIGANLVAIPFALFIVPAIIDASEAVEDEFLVLDQTLQQKFNALKGAHPVAMRQTIVNEVRRTGSLEKVYEELKLCSCDGPKKKF